MKSWLTVSFLVNVALLIAIGAVIHQKRIALAAAPSVQVAAPVNRTDVSDTREPSLQTNPAPATATLNWSQIASADYKTYIVNLRRIHCPEPIIRRIISGEIHDSYTEKVRTAWQPVSTRYWDVVLSGGSLFEGDCKEAARKLCRERDELITSLLGPAPSSGARTTDFESLLGGLLSEETAERLRQVEANYQTQLAGLRASNLPTIKMETFAKERDEAARQILGDDGMAEYQLRSAARSRSRPVGFDTTKEELRTLMSIEAKVPSDNQSRTNKARVAADEQLRSFLGDERFAQYQRSVDSDYGYLWRLSIRYNLSPDIASQVYAIEQQAKTAAETVHHSRDLSPEARESTLEQLQAETERAIQSTLGPQPAKTYFHNGAQWIDALSNARGQ